MGRYCRNISGAEGIAMNDQQTQPKTSVLLVAMGGYDEEYWEPLDQASKAASELADVLQKGGYINAHPELLKGGETGTIITKLGKAFHDANKDDILILYWTGHGKT